MQSDFLLFFEILGSIAFLIFGMKVMSNALQKAAGSQLRSLIKKLTRNKVSGILTGFTITGILQSSSAITIMTVGFVNAGLLTLYESVGIIFGANIGTTITGWLVAFVGFQGGTTLFSLPLIGISFPFLYHKSERIKRVSEVLLGIGVLFLGLAVLKSTLPDITSNIDVQDWFLTFQVEHYGTLFLFFVVGTLLTLLIQSSSAMLILCLALCSQGFPLTLAMALVLGSNLGTVVTAEVAAFVANVYARRAARIHTLFNLIGATWMFFALPSVAPLLEQGMAWLFLEILGHTNFNFQAALALCTFHTGFNILNVLVLSNFVKYIIFLARKTVPRKRKEKTRNSIQSLGLEMFSTPELSLVEANRAILSMGTVAVSQFQVVVSLLNETEEENIEKKLSRIRYYEEIMDQLNIEISTFLFSLFNTELSASATSSVHRILNSTHEMEKIGDICYQLGTLFKKKRKEQIYFVPKDRHVVRQFLDLIQNGMQILRKYLAEEEKESHKQALKVILLNVQSLKTDVKLSYLGKLSKKKTNDHTVMLIFSLVDDVERIALSLYEVAREWNPNTQENQKIS